MAAALVLAAGCGGGDGGGIAAAAVAEAATKTKDADSYRVSLLTHFEDFGGGGVRIPGKGEFDAEARRGRVTLDMSELGGGQDLGEAELVFDGFVYYMQFPALTRASSHIEPWIRVDLAKLGKQEAVDLGQLSQFGQNDPSAALEFLRGASDGVQEVGQDDVRGAETTHYRLTVDLDRVADKVPGQRASIERLIELSGVKEVPTEVWVDDRGRVRRLELLYRGMRVAPGQESDMRLTMELYDFGAGVEVEPPPPDEVTDIGELVATQREADEE